MEEVRPPTPGRVRFGVFEADLRAGQLRKHGTKIKLQEQPFQILQILLEHPGEVVTREALRQRIWPSDTFVDFDHGLNNGVKRLREALCDSAEMPRYVETLPRRGYRFIASVEGANGNSETKPVTILGELSETAVEKPIRHRRFLVPTLATVVGVSAVLLVVLVFGRGEFADTLVRKPAPAVIHSVAVLPFENLSEDPARQLLSDGMTDALITDLAQISSLKVVSRTSVLRYKKTDKSLPEIARELSVDGIVEGTVQHSGDRIRITAQLIQASTDKHLWANSYDRGAQEVLGLESEMARAIASQIRSTLTPDEETRLARARPVNLQAFEDYLQGKYHLAQAGEVQYSRGKQPVMEAELEKARDFFQKAIVADPDYAQPYVGIAATWHDGSVARGDTLRQQAALEQALRRDPNLAEAHVALADLAYLRNWNWTVAEAEFKRALNLNPNSSEAHFDYSEYLESMGRFDEGMTEFLRAQELDPGSYTPMPNPFFTRRQYQKAIEMDRADIARHAYGFEPHWDMAANYQALGLHDGAVREWAECMRILGYDELAQEMHQALNAGGYKVALAIWTKTLEAERARGENVPSFVLALGYTHLGDKDRAFAWLETAYQERDPALQCLRVDPTWDDLRSDPRFPDMLRRVGLSH